jgi:tRNA(adenine34) deaminase
VALEGCTLVVTLEPCTMCAGAIVLARVSKLVFGAYDEKAGAVGSLWDVVRDRRLNHRPEVISGVLADESTALLDEFFAEQRRESSRIRRPSGPRRPATRRRPAGPRRR